jgi:DNA-binding IclR family transcriptional regulator
VAQKTPTVQSIDALLDVVESLVTASAGMRGVTEIAQYTGLQKNRVWRMLNTLRDRGYVLQTTSNRAYQLGPGFLVLGEAFRERFDLRRVAEPFLLELTEDTGDAAFVFVRNGLRAVCADMKVGRHAVQALGRLGEGIPLHVGASPKVLLAFLPDTQRSEILAELPLTSYTFATITDRGALVMELAKIRAQGYCEAGDDYELGSYGVGVPVRDHTGAVTAAISLTMPNMRCDVERRKRAISLLLDAARRLSEGLGYRSAGRTATDRAGR